MIVAGDIQCSFPMVDHCRLEIHRADLFRQSTEKNHSSLLSTKGIRLSFQVEQNVRMNEGPSYSCSVFFIVSAYIEWQEDYRKLDKKSRFPIAVAASVEIWLALFGEQRRQTIKEAFSSLICWRIHPIADTFRKSFLWEGDDEWSVFDVHSQKHRHGFTENVVVEEFGRDVYSFINESTEKALRFRLRRLVKGEPSHFIIAGIEPVVD